MGIVFSLHYPQAEQRVTTISESKDIISDLPDHVLHHILYFLPTEEAVRTSVLSKAWHRTWKSHPVFRFKFDYESNLHSREILESKVAKFGKSLSITLHKQQHAIVKSFDISWPPYQNKYAAYIDHWISLISKRCVVEEVRINVVQDKDEYIDTVDRLNNLFYRFNYCYIVPETLFAVNSLVVLRLRGCMLRKEILGENSIFVGMQVVCLEEVITEDDIVMQLISRCPFLKECVIRNCSDVDNLPITNYDEIQELFSKLHFLETLVMDISTLFGFNISSRSLKSITLSSYEPPYVVKIDAPQLRCYEYQGNMLPQRQHLIKSTSLRQVKLDLTPSSHDDTSWFRFLRRNLALLDQHKSILQLKIKSCLCDLPAMSLEERTLPPPSSINSLELQCIVLALDYTAFTEALLWSCHPMTFSVKPNIRFLQDFLQTLLLRRHSLKDVKVKTRNGLMDFKNFHNGSLFELLSEDIIQFHLEW